MKDDYKTILRLEVDDSGTNLIDEKGRLVRK
jgi:hypothetical protein